jgi:response regulator RpfG family c-di-GMP phosphodiesterase
MKKIILAEDIQAMLLNEESFLDRSDTKIFTTNTNAEILALHRAEKADLLIMNLDSPEMSCEALSALIRGTTELCNVSIIVVHPDTESAARRSAQCRANAFVTSPIDNVILLQKVHELLNVASRRSLRVPLSIEIYVTSTGSPFIAYAENISVSGMLLHSEKLLSVGDTLKCGFYLPDSIHITTNAEIVRVIEKVTEHDTNGYGIKFIDLGHHCKAAIEAFVKKISRNR